MKRTAAAVILFTLITLIAAAAGHPGKIRKRKIRKLFKHSAIVNNHFTGFALYDMDGGKMIYGLNADKYFTPASNTKLFTFYTCLRLLGDSIPALNYVTRNDSLIFWGTGDPSFLHSDLKGINGFNFLKRSDKKLFFSYGNYRGSFYGAGWAWDDYNDDYQAEINGLPIENNVAVITAARDGSLQIKPAYLSPYLLRDSSYRPARFRVKRDFSTNTFAYPAMQAPEHFRQEVPWKTSLSLTVALLQDALKRPVGVVELPLTNDFKTIYNVSADSVYQHMLLPSDNFIAEQLLLVCSSVKFKTLDADSVIQYSKANYLNDLPDAPIWVDGSGLSRYNLFTPRSMVALLRKISDKLNNDELLHRLMPAGGLSGTIKNNYRLDNGRPFVWAKTGSLSNNYNQTGYLVTHKGRHLAFSFMNNNFTGPTREIRNELVRIITYIHDNY